MPLSSCSPSRRDTELYIDRHHHFRLKKEKQPLSFPEHKLWKKWNIITFSSTLWTQIKQPFHEAFPVSLTMQGPFVLNLQEIWPRSTIYLPNLTACFLMTRIITFSSSLSLLFDPPPSSSATSPKDTSETPIESVNINWNVLIISWKFKIFFLSLRYFLYPLFPLSLF